MNRLVKLLNKLLKRTKYVLVKIDYSNINEVPVSHRADILREGRDFKDSIVRKGK